MSKKGFKEIFQENPDGSLSPKKTIEINGITANPSIKFHKGVYFYGIDFHEYKHVDIAVEEKKEGILEIKGFYK